MTGILDPRSSIPDPRFEEAPLDSPGEHGSLGNQYPDESVFLQRKSSQPMTPETSQKSFRVERHGDIAVVIPSPEVESMHENLIQQAAQMVLAPLKEDPPAGLVIDLTQVNYFGSVFLSFLLRCHMLAKKHGSEVVLAGASERTRELLHLTALDTLWALYNTRAEAIEALAGSE
jgi:anti-anti-sigma factor